MKSGGDGEVDGGAVEVEGVAGRDDEADDGLGAAEAFHLDDHARECGFGRGGAEDDEEFFADVVDEFEDVEAAGESDEAEHDDDEKNAGDVDAEHQLAEREKRMHAVFADGEGHRAECADGSGFHDVGDDFEGDVSERVGEAGEGLVFVECDEARGR